jgi:glycosyltransferase involved in cell wall biosynthesis
MILPPVSLVIIYKDRATQLVKSLDSIACQNYPALEIVIVEDGDDGGVVAAIAQRYGARHLRVPARPAPIESGRDHYWTANQPFGNLSVLHNRAIAAASHDVVLFQDAEFRHDTPRVIEELVAQVVDNPRVLVTCSTGYETDATGATRISCGLPYSSFGCMQKATLLAMGGFEEAMEGYSYDDNYFAFLLGKNKIEVRTLATVVVTHQWHRSIGQYDYPTGRAGRALCTRLMHEINQRLRPPIANYRVNEVLDAADFSTVSRQDVEILVRKGLAALRPTPALVPAPGTFRMGPPPLSPLPPVNSYDKWNLWATGWLEGKYDEHGDTAREVIEQTPAPTREDWMMISVVEAAWALRCWENATKAGATMSAKHLMDWARTAATCAQRGEAPNR